MTEAVISPDLDIRYESREVSRHKRDTMLSVRMGHNIDVVAGCSFRKLFAKIRP